MGRHANMANLYVVSMHTFHVLFICTFICAYPHMYKVMYRMCEIYYLRMSTVSLSVSQALKPH